MTAARAPSFLWSVLAFVAIVAVVVVLATALLILLDPRSQAWWGAVFSGLGAAVHSVMRVLVR